MDMFPNTSFDKFSMITGVETVVLITILTSQNMWRVWCCWSGKGSKPKGIGGMSRICRCAFMVEQSEIYFRLSKWGKENECFDKMTKDGGKSRLQMIK